MLDNKVFVLKKEWQYCNGSGEKDEKTTNPPGFQTRLRIVYLRSMVTPCGQIFPIRWELDTAYNTVKKTVSNQPNQQGGKTHTYLSCVSVCSILTSNTLFTLGFKVANQSLPSLISGGDDGELSNSGQKSKVHVTIAPYLATKSSPIEFRMVFWKMWEVPWRRPEGRRYPLSSSITHLYCHAQLATHNLRCHCQQFSQIRGQE